MQQKIIGATDMTQTRIQARCFKAKLYEEEDRRKISSLSKFVRSEGPGSTVKIGTIMT